MVSMIGYIIRSMTGPLTSVGDLSRHRLYHTRYEDLCM